MPRLWPERFRSLPIVIINHESCLGKPSSEVPKVRNLSDRKQWRQPESIPLLKGIQRHMFSHSCVLWNWHQSLNVFETTDGLIINFWRKNPGRRLKLETLTFSQAQKETFCRWAQHEKTHPFCHLSSLVSFLIARAWVCLASPPQNSTWSTELSPLCLSLNFQNTRRLDASFLSPPAPEEA
jgi:hypothetical protein